MIQFFFVVSAFCSRFVAIDQVVPVDVQSHGRFALSVRMPLDLLAFVASAILESSLFVTSVLASFECGEITTYVSLQPTRQRSDDIASA